jgi:hypothetical protein
MIADVSHREESHGYRYNYKPTFLSLVYILSVILSIITRSRDHQT